MGGRVAEEIVFGQKTTGAGNDIEQATDLARTMVSEWGMSEKLGPAALRQGRRRGLPRPRLQRQRARLQRGDRAAHRRRDPPHRHRRTTTARSKVILDNLEKLKQIAEALLEYETLDGDDIDLIFAGKRLDA